MLSILIAVAKLSHKHLILCFSHIQEQSLNHLLSRYYSHNNSIRIRIKLHWQTHPRQFILAKHQLIARSLGSYSINLAYSEFLGNQLRSEAQTFMNSGIAAEREISKRYIYKGKYKDPMYTESPKIKGKGKYQVL